MNGLPSEIRSDQSLSHVRLFVTPWIAARQASLSLTNSQSSLRLMSIESVMLSSHLILCCPLLLLPPIPPSIRWGTPKFCFADETLSQVRGKVDQSFQTELGAICSSFHWGLLSSQLPKFLSSQLPSSTRLCVGKNLCQVPVVKMNEQATIPALLSPKGDRHVKRWLKHCGQFHQRAAVGA